MTLKLYNTLTRTKEEFKPLDRQNVRMYVCGPTVYDYAHIGNARPVIVFDVLFRLLRHLYGADHVTYVRNITDIDDKINARAREQIPDLAPIDAIKKLTGETAKQFHADIKALGVLTPQDVNKSGQPPAFVEPRATESVAAMIEIIQRLIASGHAYAAEGHVLFAVPSMKDYGQLSRRPLDEMIAGARVDVAPYKRDAMDFVLWKPSDAETPGWDSPWGRGRPGWHIECSAMSWKHLGEKFDIHGGGIDLVFPHHENELAQTRCAFGHNVMANIWMHNGFLQVEGQKMSKSLGNFVTINELLETDKFGGRVWAGADLRLAMLRTHYRQPIDWTVDALREAHETLERWRAFSAQRTDTRRIDPASRDRFMSFLSDDLNTAGAMAVIDEVVASINAGPPQRAFVFWALRLLGFKSPLSKVKRAADAIDAANRILVELSLGEIQRSLNIARERPVFGNGALRPEAKLVLALRFLDELLKRREIPLNSASPVLRAGYERKFRIDEAADADLRDRVIKLVDSRLAARKAKNWAESDRIRDELLAMGIVLKDNKDGTTSWEVKR